MKVNNNSGKNNKTTNNKKTKITLQNTGNDALDLALIQREINSAFVLIIAYGLLIVSANRARQTILLREQGLEEPKNIPNSTQIATLASSLNLIANSVLTEIAFTRFKETEAQIRSGDTTHSIVPNINVSNGFIFTVLGSALKTLGGFQRIHEQANITIF